ncbi:hypothetical protein D9619_005075 [Psilocybe cf. subviscida]|uniref:Transmembrane protein n=1 Tax=Psilocybe cf. subviscida TaxID=2480587 RepID=A0A8H5BQX5_9AGAR|nr:hypothetical protein D9619_005075 [Psilocybe cf. subviscida]
MSPIPGNPLCPSSVPFWMCRRPPTNNGWGASAAGQYSPGPPVHASPSLTMVPSTHSATHTSQSQLPASTSASAIATSPAASTPAPTSTSASASTPTPTPTPSTTSPPLPLPIKHKVDLAAPIAASILGLTSIIAICIAVILCRHRARRRQHESRVRNPSPFVPTNMNRSRESRRGGSMDKGRLALAAPSRPTPIALHDSADEATRSRLEATEQEVRTLRVLISNLQEVASRNEQLSSPQYGSMFNSLTSPTEGWGFGTHVGSTFMSSEVAEPPGYASRRGSHVHADIPTR